jgi:hypothetical protein
MKLEEELKRIGDGVEKVVELLSIIVEDIEEEKEGRWEEDLAEEFDITPDDPEDIEDESQG